MHRMTDPTYLCDTQPTPFFLPEQFQFMIVLKVLLWNLLEHVLRELHVAIFEFIVIISIVVGERRDLAQDHYALTWPSSE